MSASYCKHGETPDIMQNVLTKARDCYPYNERMPQNWAQPLYTSRHDKMLRPYYHYLLSTYSFNEETVITNDHGINRDHRYRSQRTH